MSERAQNPTSIILCEAYDSLREALELLLGERYRVASVNHVIELPKEFERLAPNLLIVDVDDQKDDPYEVLTRIRAAYTALPILLLAREFSLEQQTNAIRRLTSISFITKPYSNERFLEKVQTLIQGYASSPPQRHIIRIAQ